MAQFHQLICSPCFDPTCLRQAGDAFDGAWEEIAPNFAQNEQAAEVARLRLATIILAFSAAGRRDAASLKDAAVAIFKAREPQ